MLTPSQFSQLAAVSWHGPAATIQASASTCLLPGGYLHTIYSACYTVAGKQYHSHIGEESACPFTAIRFALLRAWKGWALTSEQLHAGSAVATSAEALFAGAAPAQEVCRACGFGRTAEGFCECGPTTTVQLAATHAA